MIRSFYVLTLMVAGVAPLSAQTVLIRNGDRSPMDPTRTVLVGEYAVNHAGGFAVQISEAGPSPHDGVWGNLDGGPGRLLRVPEVIGTFTQENFRRTNLAITDTSILYTAIVSDGATHSSSSSLWIDDQLLFIESEPYASGAQTWHFFGGHPTGGTKNFLRFTRSGVPFFGAALVPALGASSYDLGIFEGLAPTELYVEERSYPGLPSPVSSIRTPHAVSADGSHTMVSVWMNSNQRALLMNGAVHQIGGQPALAGVLVPPSAGGSGESWSEFRDVGVTENGDWFVVATTTHPTSAAAIVRNGAIWKRQGDIVDGLELSPFFAPEGASMNEHGEIAYIWRTTAGAGQTPPKALFVGDRVALAHGDPLDWDGDGTLDPHVTVFDFVCCSPPAIGADGAVHARVQPLINGVLGDYAIVRVDPPGPERNYCESIPNSTGAGAVMSLAGSTSVVANDLDVVASGLPLGAATLFLVSSDESWIRRPGGSLGTLCLGGAIGRFVGQVQQASSAGDASIDVDLMALPQPTGAVVVQPGDTWRFQAWYRDSVMTAAVSNLTDGLAIVFD